MLLYFFLSQLRSRSEARAEISNFLRKSDAQSISWGGGSIAQWLAYMLLDPAATGLIPSISKIVSVDYVHHRACLAGKKHKVDNVDQTHLSMASGKLVLQNVFLGAWDCGRLDIF